MTEATVEYKIDEKKNHYDSYCPKCKVGLGMEFEGYLYPVLMSPSGNNGVVVSTWVKIDQISGECMRCGTPIWWTSSERHLKRIIDKKQKRSHNRSPV